MVRELWSAAMVEETKRRRDGETQGGRRRRARGTVERSADFATFGWVCAVCRGINRHGITMDGSARVCDCRSCGAKGFTVVPTGPAGRGVDLASEPRVVCAECGVDYAPETHGCWKCQGQRCEAAVEIGGGR